jgi:CheY-like chemotaxis protein/anti-sigma regulatory factor (Ser/Thr protein kinase)
LSFFLQNDFIAHEVRNPLSSALAALSFIREGVLAISDDSARSSLSNDVMTVQNSLDYIDDLLRNMLDIHRTSEQDFMLRYSMTNLKNGLLKQCKDIASTRNRRKDVNFLVECSSKLWAEIDPLRLEQVLLNLAMDAAKYVDDGGFVRFRAGVVDGRVRLYVEDSGPGIPTENRERLFQRYQQSLEIISQGTGVGLHICKTLIDLMGASIRLDDSYDSGVPGCPGTRFVIDLPCSSMSRCSLSPTGFCDGNCDCRENTAATAPTKAESSSSIHLMYEEKEELCSVVDDSARNTVDIAMDIYERSGIVDGDLVDLEVGHTNTRKPARGGEDVSPMTSIDDQSPPDATSLPEPSTAYKDGDKEEDSLPENLSVLFVDDDKTLRKLFCRSARRLHHNWEVSEAHNGETALEMVKQNHYDLIFMDQYMESTTKQLLGTEVVRVMRDSDLVGDSTTICGLSANEEKERFLSAGANFFLLKPIPCSKEALKDQILRVLRETSGRWKETKDDIDVVNSQRVQGTADVRMIRDQRRRSSC